MQNLLLKPANGLKYLKKDNTVREIYQDDFDTFTQQAQLRLLPEFPKLLATIRVN